MLWMCTSTPATAASASGGIQAAKARAVPMKPPPNTMRSGFSARISAASAKQPASPGTQRRVHTGSSEKA
jgi:hypothetical protein